MRKINQNQCINVYFSNVPGIFNERFEYPVIDEQEKYNRQASQKAWPGLSVERLWKAGIVHVPQVG